MYHSRLMSPMCGATSGGKTPDGN
ncbi:MAG: hypothetical protein H6Q08_1113, partial [Acidobacteria bacterium]|nr:hypothetical protein [Acidobacteriota bacterium]